MASGFSLTGNRRPRRSASDSFSGSPERTRGSSGSRGSTRTVEHRAAPSVPAIALALAQAILAM